MIFIRRVRGSSMTPTMYPGDLVIGWRTKPRVGAVVVAVCGGRDIIKRVERIEHGQYYLVGDNRTDSTDSRHYGKINKDAILGTIMITVKKPTYPPKPVKSYGAFLGRFAALVLMSMAVIHLFRIDTFIPLLDKALPGEGVAASMAALVIVFSEVFAIPFALRMRLSLLAQVVSGALLVLVPLWWVLIDVWTMSNADATGQLGGFANAFSTPWLVLFNVAWLALNMHTLYALGYGRLSAKALKK